MSHVVGRVTWRSERGVYRRNGAGSSRDERRMTNDGFTLVELIIVLAIVTLVLGFSIPWFSQLSSGHRLKAAAREVSGVLQVARSYAISLGQRHDVVFEVTGSSSNASAGRYYIEDASGAIVEKPFALPSGVSFAAPEGEGDPVTFEGDRISFSSTGAGLEGGTVWVAGGRGQFSRVSVSEVTGQTKVEMWP